MYPFYGFDYTELAEKWGMNLSQYDTGVLWNDYETFTLFIEHFITDKFCYSHKARVYRAFCRDAREYVRAMSEWDMDESKMWAGLADIESDFNFMRLFIPLLPYAWN